MHPPLSRDSFDNEAPELSSRYGRFVGSQIAKIKGELLGYGTLWQICFNSNDRERLVEGLNNG